MIINQQLGVVTHCEGPQNYQTCKNYTNEEWEASHPPLTATEATAVVIAFVIGIGVFIWWLFKY